MIKWLKNDNLCIAGNFITNSQVCIPKKFFKTLPIDIIDRTSSHKKVIDAILETKRKQAYIESISIPLLAINKEKKNPEICFYDINFNMMLNPTLHTDNKPLSMRFSSRYFFLLLKADEIYIANDKSPIVVKIENENCIIMPMTKKGKK